jgi:hypothetical protein
MKQVNRLTVICSTVVLLFTAAAVTAKPPKPDYDGKSWPGNECQPYYGSASADFVFAAWGLYNYSTNYNYATCPVMRDDIINTDGTFAFTVNVYNHGGTLTCWLYSYDKYQNMIQSDSVSTSSFGNQQLYLDTSSSPAYGKYGLLCDLPPFSKIYTYHLYEREGDTDEMTDWNQ